MIKFSARITLLRMRKTFWRVIQMAVHDMLQSDWLLCCWCFGAGGKTISERRKQMDAVIFLKRNDASPLCCRKVLFWARYPLLRTARHRQWLRKLREKTVRSARPYQPPDLNPTRCLDEKSQTQYDQLPASCSPTTLSELATDTTTLQWQEWMLPNCQSCQVERTLFLLNLFSGILHAHVLLVYSTYHTHDILGWTVLECTGE